jgi:hypothetical protein
LEQVDSNTRLTSAAAQKEEIIMKPAGFVISVPVTLSVEVRGTTIAEAKRIARQFTNTLSPSDVYCSRYTNTAQCEGVISKAASVTAATLESSREVPCEVREGLAAENDARTNYFAAECKASQSI